MTPSGALSFRVQKKERKRERERVREREREGKRVRGREGETMLGSKQAIPGEETTRMIQATFPKDDLPEEEWARMIEEIEECKKMAWKIKPLPRREVLARLEMTKNGAEQGRSRARNSHLKALQCVPEGLSSFVNWAQMWMVGLANKDETRLWLRVNIIPLIREVDKSGRDKENKITTDCTPGNSPETDRICRC